MNTKEVNLVFFDTKERFDEIANQISDRSYKSVNQFEKFTQFEDYIKNLDANEYIIVFVHIVAETLEGYHSAVKDDLKSEYQNLTINWITRASSSINPKDIHGLIYCYFQIKEQIENDEIRAIKISDLSFNSLNIEKAFDYAIITALEENEMEKVLPMLHIEGNFENNRILFQYGYLKSNKEKRIVFASQASTGIVDAAIIATELIVRYKPKYLIMAGVLGGKPGEVKVGDVVISTKVFTIDKGKLTDNELLEEIESADTNSASITLFKRHKKKIIQYIEDSDPTRNSNINLHFEPIACVRQVIDKRDYFETKIKIRERKTIALEMESYGVARACEIVNNGNTTALIIKSAMDNTIDKNDDDKPYASNTSAMFIKYILENDLI